MTEPDICVVVPTVREHECVRAYAENAREHGFDLDRLFVCLVTEEFCDVEGMGAMLSEEGVEGAVFDGPAREAWFECRGVTEYAGLIPEASHAQTSFGLLYLWANGFDYGVFIDDDTRPHPDEDFFGTHLRNLGSGGPIEERRSDERWVNVLGGTGTDLYPRGYPYAAMGETTETRTVAADDVVVSQGLWTNVPDLDAIRILMDGDLDGQARTRLDREAFGDGFVAAPGHYLTVCSMNLAFRREVVPAFYQLPMDDNPWGIGRFDDIWSGVFLKRACDLLGKQIYTGRPLCAHDKAPRSTFDDLHDEVAGLEINEHLWRIADGVTPTAEGGGDPQGYAAVYRALADALVEGDWAEYENGGFLAYAGEHMRDWLACLDAVAPGTVGPPEAATASD